MRVPSPLRHLRLTPFDTGTEDGRRRERLRLAAWAAAANVGSKAASMVLVVASVHLTIDTLGAARFGLWMTVFSFAAMLSFLDLGIGNALTNRVARAAAGDDATALRQTIVAGLGLLAGVALVAGGLLYAVAGLLPWGRLMRSEDAALVDEARRTGQVFAVFFGLLILTGGIQKVFLGLQRAVDAHLAAAGATLLTIGAIALASAAAPTVPQLLAITLGGQALAAVPLLLLLWRRRLLQRAPLQRLRDEAPALLRSGGLFLALQIGTMVGWGADLLIVSSTLGAAQAAVFAVTQRLFQFCSVPLSILNQPLWGAYADAHARGDRDFIRRTLRRSLALTALAGSVIATVLVLLHEPIVARWTQGRIELPLTLVLAYAAWSTIEALATAAAMYMNACAILRPQMWAVLLFCLLSIPLKFALAGAAGLAGVVLATIAAYLVAVPLLYALCFRDAVTAPLRPA